MKPLVIVLGLNALFLAALYAEAYGPGADGSEKGAVLFAPFVVSAVNLCLGLVCVVIMLVLKGLGRTAAAAVADKFMQAFVIAFGVVLAFAVPACFIGISHL